LNHTGPHKHVIVLIGLRKRPFGKKIGGGLREFAEDQSIGSALLSTVTLTATQAGEEAVKDIV